MTGNFEYMTYWVWVANETDILREIETMKCLFEVNGYNGFQNNKKMLISVYGVRTSEDSKCKAEFLVYYNGEWHWIDTDNYTPIDNKHS